jgi:hypothetical protein
MNLGFDNDVAEVLQQPLDLPRCHVLASTFKRLVGMSPSVGSPCSKSVGSPCSKNPHQRWASKPAAHSCS